MKMDFKSCCLKVMLTLFIAFSGSIVLGQDIRVNIQINRLPTGGYPTKLYQFQQNPNIVTVMITNTGQTSHKLYLNGTITSDNGMLIRTKPNYTPGSITIGPMQQRLLNVSEIIGLFDANSLDVLQNGDDISGDFLRKRSLPEGMYQVCVRAYDYTTRQPISSDEPLGCSNLFTIANLEAPVVLSPFNEEEIRGSTVQNLIIRWSMPPGAPPGTQYTIRLFDAYSATKSTKSNYFQANAAQVFKSSSIPLFETTVTGINQFLYGPSQPQLIPGHQYVLAVIAKDPQQNISFRNGGQSSPIMFSFKPINVENIAVVDKKLEVVPKPDFPPMKFATNQISGRVLWAFKRSEVNYAHNGKKPDISQALANMQRTDLPTANISAPAVIQNGPQAAPQTSATPVNFYLGHNTLQAQHATALGQADPTLGIASTTMSGLSYYQNSSSTAPMQALLPADRVISSAAAQSISYEYKTIPTDTAEQRFPLAGVTVMLKGRKKDVNTPSNTAPRSQTPSNPANTLYTIEDDIQYSGLRTSESWSAIASSAGIQTLSNSIINQSITSSSSQNAENQAPLTVLASGVTDAEGNYNLSFMHPEYSGLEQYTHLVVTVKSENFARFEYKIPVNNLDSLKNINLGEMVLLANTYRFKANLKAPNVGDEVSDLKHSVVRIYREASDLEQHPYLKQEGNIPSAEKTVQNINGRQMILIGIDSASAGDSEMQSFTFGKLFYQGKLHVVVESSALNLKKVKTTLAVTPQSTSSNTVMLVNAEYSPNLKQPAVSGRVILYAGENTVPVPGAIVKVTYNPDDVDWSGFSNMNIPISTTQSINIPANVTNNGIYSTTNTPGTNPLNFSTTSASNGVAIPVEVNSQTVNNKQQLGYTTALPPTNLEVAGNDILSIPTVAEMYGSFAVRTDSSGYFYVGALPTLKPGAQYTLKLFSLPHQFEKSGVDPASREIPLSLSKGIIAYKEFKLNAEVVPLAGRVVDETGNALSYARLHFKGSSSYFETGQSGLFLTSYVPGTHTLVIEKTGYQTKAGEIHIGETKTIVDTPLVKRETEPVEGANRSPQQLNVNNESGFYTSVTHTATLQAAIDNGEEISPASFGWAVNAETGGQQAGQLSIAGQAGIAQNAENQNFTPLMQNVFSGSTVTYAEGTQDMGKLGYLAIKRAKVLFTVKDKDNASKLLEGVTVSLFDTMHVTDSNGQWLYEGFGGKVTVLLSPPEGLGYIPVKTSIDLAANNQLSEVTLFMEKGIRVYGTVSSGSSPIKDVNIAIEGKDYLATTSNEDGSYQLFLPTGEQVLRVAKSGYLVQKENRTLEKGQDLNIDFQLDDGGGNDIGHLLGFEIELEKTVPDGDGAIWTGRFVNLKPYIPVFESENPLTLPFANIKVTFDENGNALPQNNEVITDKSRLQLELFGYLPISFLNDGERIKVKQNADGEGSISGQLQLDVDRILGDLDIEFVEGFLPEIVAKDRTSPGSIEFFLEEGADGLPGLGEENMNDIEDAATNAASNVAQNIADDLPPGNTQDLEDLKDKAEDHVVDLQNLKFRLAAKGSKPVKMELYGFAVILDLANTTISPDGLALAGTIQTPALGPVKAMSIPLKTLDIDQQFRVQELAIKADDLPELKIGNWKASLTSVLINQNGLKLGGEVSVTLPSSGTSTLAFSNLKITTDAIYGGEFDLKGNGIDLFGAAQLLDNGSKMRFGQVGNTDVYSLSGSVDIHFEKLLEDNIKIPRFQIQTDGHFSLQTPVDFNANLGFASYTINDFVISNASGQMPYIEFLGKFKTDIPFLDFSASNIKFQATESGEAELIVGKISGQLDVPVLECGVELELRDNGFAGGGNFEVPGTSISADVNFHYYQLANGVDLGASFVAGAPIPLGTITISKLGGGFQYNSSDDKFKVTITGEASVSGLSQAVKLAPINLSVESGPIIKGDTKVIIGDDFELARSTVELNFPAKLFAVTVDAKMKPMEGLGKAQLNGLMRISWDENNPYAFLGVNADIKLSGLVNANGQFALGVNVENPKYGDQDIATYFRNLDDGLISSNYTFSGLYAYGEVNIGPPQPKIGGDFWIASFSASYHAHADACFLLNFAEGDYLFSLNGNLGASAKACVDIEVWEGCMSADFDACFRLAGGRTHQKGWFFGGAVGASLYFKIGDVRHLGCNDWRTGWWDVETNGREYDVGWGVRGCISAHASIDYSERDGLDLDGGIGENNNGNLCL